MSAKPVRRSAGSSPRNPGQAHGVVAGARVTGRPTNPAAALLPGPEAVATAVRPRRVCGAGICGGDVINHASIVIMTSS